MLYELVSCVVAGIIGGGIVSAIWFGTQVISSRLRRRRW